MNDRSAELSNLILRITDFFLVNIAYLVMMALGLMRWHESAMQTFSGWDFLLVNVIWLVGAFIFNAYSNKWKDAVGILRKTYRVIIFYLLIFSAAFFFLLHPFHKTYLLFLVGFYLILFSFILLSRLYVVYIVEFVAKNAHFQKKCMILGKNEAGLLLSDFFRKNGTLHQFNGFLDNQQVPDGYLTEDPHRIYKYYVDYAQKNDVDEIFATNTLNLNLETLINIAENRCVKVKVVNVSNGFFLPSAKPMYQEEYIASLGMSISSRRSEPLLSFSNRLKKRLFDLLFSGLIIVFVMSWLYPILAILIKLSSPGPVLFRQQRSGRDNKTFDCLKFRSMRVNKDADKVQATKFDTRVTKIGAFMRKTSLDEFPQFFNVLIGNMSIVGPRPHMLQHTELYSKLIDKYLVRQFLKPGITGWAQVNGYRGETKNVSQMAKRVEYDIWYMENWSAFFDVKIIAMTIINIIKGEPEAY